MTKRFIGCLLLFRLSSLLAQTPVFYDSYFRSQAQSGIDLIYNMEFNRAEQVFTSLQNRYAGHPGPYFLLALNRWWETYVAAHMHTHHAYIETHLDKALELNKAIKDCTPCELEYNFFQFMSYAFKARLYTLRKEWLNAAGAGRKALPYLKKGLDFVDRSPEFYFSSGIYHYYAEEYPKEHAYVKPFMVFFPDGDAKLGIEELKKSAETINFTQPESIFYLGDIYLKRGEYGKGLELYRKMSERYPGNTWFKMEYARALVQTGYAARAINILNGMIDRYKAIPGHQNRNIHTSESLYTTYLITRVYFWKGVAELWYIKNYENALASFNMSKQMSGLAKLQDDEYEPALHYYLGVVNDRLGERSRAIAYYEYVINKNQQQLYKTLSKQCIEKACK